MKFAVLLATAVVFTPSTSTPEPLNLRLAPEAGLLLSRSFERATHMEARGTSARGAQGSTTDRLMRLQVTDEVRAVSGERITQLARTFEDSENSTERVFDLRDAVQPSPTTLEAEIEGATVLFDWSDQDEAYRASSATVEQEVLQELRFDYDFTALLPERPVSEGDEWMIDPVAFRAALEPWTGIPWDWDLPSGEGWVGYEDEGEDPEVTVSGRLRGIFAGVRTRDGVELAFVTLQGELEVEWGEEVEREVSNGVQESSFRWSETQQLIGRAAWNLELGCLHSLELTTTAEVEYGNEGFIRRGDDDTDISSITHMRRVDHFTATTEPAE